MASPTLVINGKPSFKDFWKLRGTTCFWVSEHVGYRIGTACAVPAHRLGLSPNAVSVLSLIVGVGGASWVAFGGFDLPTGGLLLAFFLLLANGLDCTDGLLARYSGTGSSFGALFDKMIDMLSIIWIPGVLGAASMQESDVWVPQAWRPLALIAIIGVRPAQAAVSWLKDSQRYRLSRAQEIAPHQGWGWKLRRLIGNLTDDVPWRLGTAISWGVGLFWEFSLLFSLVCLAIFVPYVLRTKRDLDTMDQEAKSSLQNT
jgi:phosphatidylglycerophosphate synthase